MPLKGMSTMATYKIRGSSHNVIYTYRTDDGKYKQHWESYDTELEAIQRKAYIDFLQKNRRQDDIRLAAAEYKEKRTPAKASTEPVLSPSGQISVTQEDNTHRTYAEFIERFLPFYARKQRFSPNTYDSYAGNLKNHILPYFGDCIMSRITAEDIDNFLDYLSKKPCKGSKSYGKKATEAPKLSSATIKKCYNILIAQPDLADLINPRVDADLLPFPSRQNTLDNLRDPHTPVMEVDAVNADTCNLAGA